MYVYLTKSDNFPGEQYSSKDCSTIFLKISFVAKMWKIRDWQNPFKCGKYLPFWGIYKKRRRRSSFMFVSEIQSSSSLFSYPMLVVKAV